MDLKATVTLKNLPEMDLDRVENTLRGAVCEWLDYDRHPDDVTVELLAESRATRPIYCVSDLHLGDGGPRDNFTQKKMDQFRAFLDYVEGRGGRLIILGDLFEFWQANISKVIMRHLPLLDRLLQLDTIYVLGNHDADLLHFCGQSILNHAFFSRMVPEHEETVSGRRIKFVHGHQADPYCASDTPGKGRISAIYSGIWEDRNGSPWVNKYRTVEEATVGRVERLLSVFYRLLGHPGRLAAMNINLESLYPGFDAIISGHTHRAGLIGRLYNTGTWAERVNSFVAISEHGAPCVYDWSRCAVPNMTELPL